MNSLNVRLYDTYGCTLVGTAMLQSLRATFPKSTIHVYTKNPDLLMGLTEVNSVIDARNDELEYYDVDIRNYLQIRKPQENTPFRHLIVHMLEMASSQLSSKLPTPLIANFYPKVNLSAKELEEAHKIVSELSSGKSLIWLQTKSSSRHKDWNGEYWAELTNLLKSGYSIVDLSDLMFTRRQAIAITKFCEAGVTLDTFLLHGSEAVQSKNTVTILLSSHPEVVAYPDQIVLSESKEHITPKKVFETLKAKLS